jgi:putative transposase
VFAAAGGPPKVLPMDNGPELFLKRCNVFAKVRCLNRNHWNILFEAWVVIGDFKHEHNHRHRHSALGYRTPAEYAAACRHTHTPRGCEIN